MVEQLLQGAKRIAISRLEVMMAEVPPVEIPVIHRFCKNMYIRECQIPAGAALTSMEHKTEHPYFILEGDIVVGTLDPDDKGKLYRAPYFGITPAGTKRLLVALTYTRWFTCHVTELTDPDEIGKEILEKLDNPLLDGVDPARINGWMKNSPYQGKHIESCPGSQSES